MHSVDRPATDKRPAPRPATAPSRSPPAQHPHHHQRPSSPKPRTTRASLSAHAVAMAAQLKARIAPRRARTPNCTHISMERVYCHDTPCPVCLRVPPMGFLYECRQDSDVPLLPCTAIADTDSIDDSAKSQLRRELEEAGLSESIIATAEQGGYADTQLDKLKALKDAMRQTIVDAMQPRPVACGAPGPSNNDGASASSQVKRPVAASCSYRACHTCRPYFKDRIYISFGAFFADEFRPLTHFDVALLPIKSALVMRHIGLGVPSHPALLANFSSTEAASSSDSVPSSDSTATYRSTESDVDDLDENRRHRRQFYRMGRRSSGSIARDLARLPFWSRHGLKAAFNGIFRPSRESSSSGSTITLPLPRTGFARDDAAVGEFDMGALRRVRRQKERNDLRSCTYADAMNEVGASQAEEHGSEVSSSSDFSVYSFATEGSEVEVAGGVALTEEAVEMQTPDILSDPLATELAGVSDDTEDLGSIMTQV